eukprot:scaffold2125_cov126-Cylindrotheca_fusiformis.AAC.5
MAVCNATPTVTILSVIGGCPIIRIGDGSRTSPGGVTGADHDEETGGFVTVNNAPLSLEADLAADDSIIP